MNIPGSVTFAFSKKQEAWTTRYSFTPTCYANCGDTMLSSRDDDGVWKHDSNQKRNSFYGSVEESSLTVSSNQDPSAIKLFKSISIESNKKDWKARFSSNDEYNDKNKQISNVVSGFEDKEGFKYLEVPRDILNSTGNIQPCPGMSVILPEDVPFGGIGSTASEIGFSIFSNAGSSSTPISFSVPLTEGPLNLSVSHGEILCNHEGELKSFSSFVANSVFNLSALNVSGFTDSSAAISTALWNLTELTIDGFVDYLVEFFSNPLFVVSNASVNGDQMRGPYLKTNLSIKTEEPLELHAVNIDYEFSNLDKRLTQNS